MQQTVSTMQLIADARRPRQRAPRVWRYSYGKRPHVVAACERQRGDGQVWLRWSSSIKAKRDNREYHPLGFSVRDQRTGELDRARVKAAKLAVQQLYEMLLVRFRSSDTSRREPARLQAGLLPQQCQLASTYAVDNMTVRVRPRPATLTLLQGFRMALDPRNGMYPTTVSRRYRDMQNFVRRLFGQPGGEPATCRSDDAMDFV